MAMLAVVPIFMGAGAALMPTIIAAVASVAAVIFKPRELVRVVRERPMASGGTILAMVLIVAGGMWWFQGRPVKAGTVGRGAEMGGASRIDWAKVAEELIARQQAGLTGTGGATTQILVTGSDGAGSGGSKAANAAWIEGHDMARTSYGGGPSPVGLKSLWAYKPEGTMFLSSPAIWAGDGGKEVFEAGCQSDLGGYTGILSCLDAETGKAVWEITALGDDILPPFFSSPALTADGKYLVIGQGLHEDKNCSLLCFDTATKALKWAVKTPLHIESSPAIFGDMAVVGAGAIEGPDGNAIGNPGFVLAVRISDGKELWRQQVNDPESSPAVDEEGNVYIGAGFNGNAVVAMRGGTAEELKGAPRMLWKTPLPHPMTGSISLIGDLVIAGGGNSDVVHSNPNPNGMVVALERKTGKIRWQTPLRDSVLSGVAAKDGMLVCGARTGEVMALSQEDGKILWHTPISGKAAVIASCAFAGEKIYAVSSDGYLAVLEPKTGKVVEKIYINDQKKAGTGLSASAPQVIDGRIIVGSETGGLQCLVGTGGK